MREKFSSMALNMLLPSAFAPLSSKHLPSTTKENSIQLSWLPMHERIEAYWWSITLRSHTILKEEQLEQIAEQLEQRKNNWSNWNMEKISVVADQWCIYAVWLTRRIQEFREAAAAGHQFHKNSIRNLLKPSWLEKHIMLLKKKNQNQVLPHFVAEILETYTLTYIYPAGKKSLLLLEDQ